MGVYYPQGAITLKVLWENFGETAKQNELHTLPILARRVNVSLNDYTRADTFTLEIDYKNFPFDPRTIRSCGVTIHIEDREKLFRRDNALNILTPTEENTVFVGFADMDRIKFNEDTRSITLEGRDYTSLLIDNEYFAGPVSLTQPLDKILEGLLKGLKATENIKLDNRTRETLPTLSQLGIDLSSKQAGRQNARKKGSYWDVIQKIVGKAGLIAYIELDKLVLTKPRNLYANTSRKLFVYGRNLIDLEFERKLGRQKGFNIRVLSLNVEKKTVLDAKIPKEATEAFSRRLGIKREEITIPRIGSDGKLIEPPEVAPYITFRLADIGSKSHLISRGEEIFEEVGRQQIAGSLTTKEMKICEKISPDELVPFKATSFRIGNPIEIEIDQGDMNGLTDLVDDTKRAIREIKKDENNKRVEKTKAAIVKFLLARCYEKRIAVAMSETLTKFDTPFYTKEIELSLDQEAGFQMKIKFVNFIEISQKARTR